MPIELAVKKSEFNARTAVKSEAKKDKDSKSPELRSTFFLPKLDPFSSATPVQQAPTTETKVQKSRVNPISYAAMPKRQIFNFS